MRKKWLDEFARDLIAFGSIPFLVITLARVSVLEPYYPMQFVISSIPFFILIAVFKGSLRAGLALIMLIFISLHYASWLFAIFAALVYIGLLASLVYLKRGRIEILKGISFGAVSTGIGYFLVRLIFF
jgi:hypothetical protein